MCVVDCPRTLIFLLLPCYQACRDTTHFSRSFFRRSSTVDDPSRSVANALCALCAMT